MPDGFSSSPDMQLPRWDLSDLYAGMDSSHIEADLLLAEKQAKNFAQIYQGKVHTLTGEELAAALDAYQACDEIMGKLASYAQLLFAADSTNGTIGQFYQNINEKITNISSFLLFFTLELNTIEEENLNEKLKTPVLSKWTPFLRDLRVFRPHQLSDELEKLLHEKTITGHAAWSRLFDETMATLTVDIEGQTYTLGDAFNLLSRKDRSLREKAGVQIGKTLSDNIRLLTLITNTLAKDKQISDEWRHYARPGSSRNCANMVEDEVVDALVQAVTSHYPDLSHRYYAMKAKWLGLEKMEHWDRNAPLPEDNDQLISWEEAKNIVQTAYSDFDPRMGDIAQQFLTKPWIDAALSPGKNAGAFAHPTVPSAHPYLLVNFHGRPRDVMTLAHEMGHGIHQVLAAEQGYLMSNTPLTLAETASVFGEMLTFRSLLERETDPMRKRIMLAGKVEDMLNTVIRQIAFYQFETRVHETRRHHELLPDELGKIWRDIQQESLGPIFNFTPEYDTYWSYIPHFIHTPFYVYAYAFGDCLVNSLYQVYQEKLPGFKDKYIDMLRAGGTKRHKELLAPFGLDASHPDFWNKGLAVISHMIDQLEQM